MSKYALLWDYVQKSEEPFLQLTFAEIDGWQVEKISMKAQTVLFTKTGDT